MGVLFGGIQRKGVDHKKVVKNLTKEQRAMYSEKKITIKKTVTLSFLILVFVHSLTLILSDNTPQKNANSTFSFRSCEMLVLKAE